VGLRSHSEIGWVLREYNDLINKASKLGIKSPDSYYTDGKTRGKASKDMGVDAQKAAERAGIFVKKVGVSDIGTEISETKNEPELNTPMREPTLNLLPYLVKQSKSSEIPGLLEGFKPHRRR